MMDDISLPPLSIAGAAEHLPSLHSYRLTDSIPPIDSQETEEILQNQYAKLQSSLLDSFDSQRKKLEYEVSNTKVVLKRTLNEKIDLGVSLHQSQTHVSLLNRSVAKTYG